MLAAMIHISVDKAHLTALRPLAAPIALLFEIGNGEGAHRNRKDVKDFPNKTSY